MRTIFLIIITCAFLGCSQTKKKEVGKPNIVIFYVDDLGYGDLSSYGSTQIQTPNVDKLANQGIRFTDGHCSSATCTPSRYSLLTGEHAFRNNAEILAGDAPLLISPDKPTLPKMLQKAGYKTAVIGKWHLGLGNGDIDWNDEVKPGPLEIGFDYGFLLPATGDRVPCVYLENYRVVNLNEGDSLAVSYKKKIGNRPSGLENPELLRYKADKQHSNTIINGVSRIGYMAGGQSAEWVDEEFPNQFIGRSKKFIDESKDNPFFLFFSFHDIHVPRLPMEQFQGKSGMGPRGDAILQMDWTVGQVMKLLEERGLANNTLVVFSSDNGAVLDDGYGDNAMMVNELETHAPSGPYSGGKYSALEGGTRVPTIISWPNRIKSKVSEALFSQVDIYASLASLLDQPLASNEALDSEDHAGVMLGEDENGREFLIEESSTLSLRYKNWKYIRPSNSDAGWIENHKNIASGISETPQLYNLEVDVAEQVNLAEKFPNRVKTMEQKIKAIEAKSKRY